MKFRIFLWFSNNILISFVFLCHEVWESRRYNIREIVDTISELMEFLFPKVENVDNMIQIAILFDLTISPKQKYVSFQFAGV